MVRYGEILEGNADDSNTSYLQRKQAIASALEQEIKTVTGVRLEIAKKLKTAAKVRT